MDHRKWKGFQGLPAIYDLKVKIRKIEYTDGAAIVKIQMVIWTPYFEQEISSIGENQSVGLDYRRIFSKIFTFKRKFLTL